MAVLDPTQLAKVRQRLAKDTTSQSWTKAEANAALQAIEDWWHKPAVQSSLNTDVVASSSFVWDTPQKKAALKHWLKSKFDRGDV